MTDEEMLARAVAEARQGLSEGGIPIGAVLHDGAGARRRAQPPGPAGERDPARRDRLPGEHRSAAGKRLREVDDGHDPSPCDMCTGAILLYGIPRVVVGENRNFVGGEALLASRGVEVVVLDDAGCVEMMASSSPRTRRCGTRTSAWRTRPRRPPALTTVVPVSGAPA